MVEVLALLRIRYELKSGGRGTIVEGHLIKVLRFGDYLKGIEFAGRCGKIAEGMNHHPDLLIQWRKVTVSISTHSAGGLTALDFEFANKIEG